MPSLGSQNSCKPSRHTFYQVLTHLLWYLLPFCLTALPKLLQTLGWVVIFIKPLFDVPPEVFNRADIWGLCRPLHDSESMVLEPVLSLFTGMLGVIILLEDNISGGFVVIVERFLKLLIQDGTVELCIHLPFSPSCIPNAFPEHTAPHHHITTPQTSLCSPPACHSMVLPPLSTPISCHLTPGD